MRFIAEIEETVTRLRKIIIESDSIKEAEEIIYNSIDNSEDIEELHSNLKSNTIIKEIKDHDYEGEEFELTYIGEFK